MTEVDSGETGKRIGGDTCEWAAAPLGIFGGSFCLLPQLPPLPQQSGWVLWCVKRAMGNIKDGLAAKG